MKSDKQQMSYVPQTSEHVKITGVTTSAVPYDIKLPKGAYVEDVKVVVTTVFGDAVADIDIGTTANAAYYKATSIDAGNSTGSTGVYGIDAAKMMDAVASDQIVRVTVQGGADVAGEAWVWVNYRFDSNPYPTQLV
jgi:hypothetical protein